MRTDGMRRSDNVEDRRGMSGGGKLALGGGLGGIIIAVVLLLLGGGDSSQVLESIQQAAMPSGSGQAQPLSEDDKKMGDFVAVILADLEEVWGAVFQKSGRTYEKPKLVLFSNATESACGYASGATGPFYCPGDDRVYLDLAFFAEMQSRLGFNGDFALAYVIAHEVGHHVQKQLGIMDQVMAQQNRIGQVEFNKLMVRMELQADFLAGVWAHYAQRTQGFIETGDIEEGMNAASAVGDDRLQRQSQGRVVPDSFTHGTSEQRVRWFRKGLQTGDVNQGDTFQASVL